MKGRNELLVLEPVVNGFDIGNTANSVAVIVPPVRCSIIAAQICSNSASANSYTVTIGLTNTATLAGSLVVPDSTGAFAYVQDTLAVPYEVAAGVALLDIDWIIHGVIELRVACWNGDRRA